MKVSSLGAGLFFVVAVLAACSSSSSTDAGDGGTSNEGGAVTCCPPDPSPGCCMTYGGSKQNGMCPPRVCDGIPQPGDPGWKLVKNSDGCDEWTNTSPHDGGLCGQATLDSGHPIDDGGSDDDANPGD